MISETLSLNLQLRQLLFISALLLFSGHESWGQGPELTPTFQFKDGIYFDLAGFQADAPAIPGDSLEGQWVLSNEGMLLQVADLRVKGGKAVDMDAIWGICLDGIPYLPIPKDENNKPLPAFAALRLVGNLCYFRYETELDSTLSMPVYNPLTGKPFRESKINRTFTIVKEKLLRFEDGERGDFTLKTLLQWMQNDPDMVRALREEADAEDLEELMYRALLSYNRRHPKYIKP